MYKLYFKRIIDFIGASIFLIAISPVFLLLILLLAISNKGKAFFIQRRPGKNCKVFKIIKFKTMNDKKDKKGALLSDGERLTRIGLFVRKMSLDEIPQLLNVIKGDMSLIGPRPLLEEYLLFYSEFENRRHNVKPGITGWAQINGRNAISWKQKFEYDVWYVDNLTLFLDLKIIILTIKKVFKSEGISQDGEATMEFFKGN